MSWHAAPGPRTGNPAQIHSAAVGRFGAQWAEWNDRFRDSVRDFWRGAAGIRSLTIDASDPFAARLFAGWLQSRLRWTAAVEISIRVVKGDGSIPLAGVKLAGGEVAVAA